jgi:hypothetical protein
MTREEADKMVAEKGWVVREDAAGLPPRGRLAQTRGDRGDRTIRDLMNAARW